MSFSFSPVPIFRHDAPDPCSADWERTRNSTQRCRGVNCGTNPVSADENSVATNSVSNGSIVNISNANTASANLVSNGCPVSNSISNLVFDRHTFATNSSSNNITIAGNFVSDVRTARVNLVSEHISTSNPIRNKIAIRLGAAKRCVVQRCK